MTNKKILVVDDDPDVRKGMHLRLAANDYDTCFAADGVTAIAEARKQKPDLIILDLGLPAGDGFGVMERLKAIPTLDISARDAFANKSFALNAGAKAFLQKPVDNSQFLAVIRQTLGEAAPPKKSVVYDLDLCDDVLPSLSS